VCDIFGFSTDSEVALPACLTFLIPFSHAEDCPVEQVLLLSSSY